MVRKIRKIENDPERFDAVVARLAEADAVIWCYPVYFMLVSAQLKRFVELLFERGAAAALAGKVTTSLSTSAHFYDHTAHDYVRGVCSDLGMIYVRGFSAGMDDLLSEAGRHNLEAFARDFFWHASGDGPVEPGLPPVQWTSPVYDPPPAPNMAKRGDRRIVVVSDADEEDRTGGARPAMGGSVHVQALIIWNAGRGKPLRSSGPARS